MTGKASYFFCGIGGSGMLPLATILRARGHAVDGSDRMLDHGGAVQKFDFLRARGINLFPQDGSGLTANDRVFVASAAVEDSVPDMREAKRRGLQIVTRAELLAELFNRATTGVAVGGTSGKSTTTGMIGWILSATGRNPTIMNGAVMKNFAGVEAPFASAVVGDPDLFVSEVDESDGSIALFAPRIAVLNNVALDHKPLPELRALFAKFVAKAETAVVNLDNPESRAIARTIPADRLISTGLDEADADLTAESLIASPTGISFHARERSSGTEAAIELRVPGRHNVANALSALGAARACGVAFEDAAQALGGFEGLRRRLDFVGEANGLTVIDDFAHNPDKIEATLDTLHAFPGRLLVMFQPHGFGPLRMMREAYARVFAEHLGADDLLLMPPPVYYGGTVERSVTNEDIVADIVGAGGRAEAHPDRDACGKRLLELARPGDRIVVMGARDDTLSQFAKDLLERLG